MKKCRHIVGSVVSGSIAEELGIEPGDEVLSVNDQPIEDVFDYHYLMNEEYVEMLIRKKNGEEWLLEIEKEYEEDAGIEFENPLMDEYRSCSNHCVFCFIDQMPKGMRDTLYFKDDDSRLSFLQGNYVTLTNMSDHDIDRIIRYHLSPINISFHTTNPELRCKMLNNRFAGMIFDKVERLCQAGIEMNGQIVLCKGLNDKKELERTILDLSRYMPCLKSVSVVPVGLTKFRKDLYPLEAFQKENAQETLEIIEKWQKHFYEEHGTHFIHAGDEWYLLAEKDVPEADSYDGYPQLENGVGMVRLLEEEIKEGLARREGDLRYRRVSIATGLLAEPHLKNHAERIQKKYPNVRVLVYGIQNDFFGHSITVSGLITGTDLKKQLKGRDLGEELLLPINMLRDGETVFLDDVTIRELEQYLNVKIRVVEQPGEALLEAVLGEKGTRTQNRRQIYEQTDCCYCGQTECGEIHTF
ncbi:MAG: DUF512 domain-containing protein [Lachnospiraceae bacterium]|nr:DUF512 domain-containing protein [Lachnospiraceae bacterium]